MEGKGEMKERNGGVWWYFGLPRSLGFLWASAGGEGGGIQIADLVPDLSTTYVRIGTTSSSILIAYMFHVSVCLFSRFHYFTVSLFHYFTISPSHYISHPSKKLDGRKYFRKVQAGESVFERTNERFHISRELTNRAKNRLILFDSFHTTRDETTV